MTNPELDDLVTFCCGANYIRKGRARYICDDCREDRSIEFIMMIDSQEKADRLEQWRQAAMDDENNKKLKLKYLGAMGIRYEKET